MFHLRQIEVSLNNKKRQHFIIYISNVMNCSSVFKAIVIILTTQISYSRICISKTMYSSY